MKTSESLESLFSALVSAQAELSPLPKTAAGYNYKYVPFDAIVAAVRPVLAKNNLAFLQLPTHTETQGAVALTTRLVHKSGEWLEDTAEFPIPSVGRSNDAQAYGAAITYARRYALSALLGIATDEDSDAATPQKAQPKRGAQPQQHPAQSNRPEAQPADAAQSLEVYYVGIQYTKTGKKQVGFWGKDDKYPSVRVWSKADLLQVAPFVGLLYGPDYFGDDVPDGKKYPFHFTLHHTDDKYPSPLRADFTDAHRQEIADMLFDWAGQRNVEATQLKGVPSDEWITNLVDAIRQA
ncbi:MAG: ERF family protein [FCB group bacterium]|nr:ERF family protein [FCB group bacterium]